MNKSVSVIRIIILLAICNMLTILGYFILCNTRGCSLNEEKEREIDNQVIMKNVVNGIEEYFKAYGKLPESMQELHEDSQNKSVWVIEKLDVWGNHIVFIYTNNYVVIKSLGSDGKTGGIGEAADANYKIENKDNVLLVEDFDKGISP